jgi:Calcineurin-like phosphoesterase
VSKRKVIRAGAIASSLMVLILLSVPPVRAMVFDALGQATPFARPSRSPNCRPAKKCPSPSPSPSNSPSPSPSPSPGGDPVIAAAGDIACQSSSATTTTCRQQSTSDLLAGGGFDAVLDLGDNQYEAGALSAYQTYYGPTWGRSQIFGVTHPAAGNHEYGTANAAGYFSYFGSKAGDPSKGYYSYDVGTWHLIALNSNCANVGGCAAGSVQEQWLRADLAAHPATCTLAYWHHPRFSSGTTHGSSTTYMAFWQALYDFGADVVLVGHEHNYERFGLQTAGGVADANGIRQFVVGTGGKSHYGFGAAIANSEVRNSTTFGVLKLTLHPTGYNWQFVPEAGGTFSDIGSTACH